MKVKITCRPRYNPWLKKYLNTKTFSKMLALGILINNIPINSFAGILSDDGRFETFEGSDITINDILEEDKVDVEIEGNTLVNLVKYNNISVSYDECKDYQVLNTKPNQLYTIVIDVSSNTVDNGVWFSAYEFAGELKDSSYYLPESVKGDTKIASNGQTGRFILKCGFSQRGALDISRFVLFSNNSTSGSFTASAMVFEGDLNESELPDKYFEGIKSVGQDDENGHKIEVVSNNKNLISQTLVVGDIGTDIGDLRLHIDTHAVTKEFIKCKGDTNYSLSYTPVASSRWFTIFEYDKNFNLIKTNDTFKNFTTDKKTNFLRLKIENKDNINITDLQLEENIIATSYTNQKSNIKKIPLSEPLRGLPNGAKDRIIKRNGQWYIERNCGEIVLDGSDDEKWVYESDWTGNCEEISRFNIAIPKQKYNSWSNLMYENKNYSINDSFNSLDYLIDTHSLGVEHFSGWDLGRFVLNIKTSRLSVENELGLKEWLLNNPIKLVYQLDKPIYEPIKIDLSVNLFEGTTHISTNSSIPANLKVTVDRTMNRATEAVELAKINPTTENLSLARMWTNLLRESIKKDELQAELNNNIDVADLQLERKTASSNVDVYIKSENMLSMNLSTNSITFDDFSGVEDMIKENAVNISINSSLPYNLNAYLATEIQNSDKSVAMNKDILSIKDNSELDYQTFSSINNKIVLKSNCNSGNDKQHDINLKLNSGIAHEKDVYKATIKFEAEQQ